MKFVTHTVVVFLFLFSSNQLHAELKGDEAAIALADQMIDSIGGKKLWAKIRTLYVVEKSRSLKGDGIISEFWRDLQRPREWYTLNNRHNMVVRTWWDENGIYQTLNGKKNHKLPADLHKEVQAYWQGEIYVMYHRFARGDESLQLKMNEDDSFRVFDQGLNRHLGTFWVNNDGQLYRWRHADGTEYIYGPHRSFGEISFPDWGTQVDGSWSFYYTEVRWSEEEAPVSYEAPY